jgi:hypothetical protein
MIRFCHRIVNSTKKSRIFGEFFCKNKKNCCKTHGYRCCEFSQTASQAVLCLLTITCLREQEERLKKAEFLLLTCTFMDQAVIL